MPSDFGDDAGEKLCDWMLRIGQDVGSEAMRAASGRIVVALRKTRGDLGEDVPGAGDESPQWARLKLDELSSLEEYDTIRDMIDQGLEKAGVEHGFFRDGSAGRDYLLFHIEDAARVSQVFDETIGDVEAACERASTELARMAREKDIAERQVAKDVQRGQTDPAREAATRKDVSKCVSRDGEPLDERAARARTSAAALEQGKKETREIGRTDRFEEVRAR